MKVYVLKSRFAEHAEIVLHKAHMFHSVSLAEWRELFLHPPIYDNDRI